MRPIITTALGLVLAALAGLTLFLHHTGTSSAAAKAADPVAAPASATAAESRGPALSSGTEDGILPRVALESAGTESPAPERPAAAGAKRGFTKEERLKQLQHQKQAFEACLQLDPGLQYANGYQLDLMSIAALLDAQHREQVNEAHVKISLSPSHAGEHRFVYGNHLYAFDYSEFPGHETLQRNCGIAIGAQGADPASLDFSAQLQTSIMDRANSALELLTRGS